MCLFTSRCNETASLAYISISSYEHVLRFLSCRVFFKQFATGIHAFILPSFPPCTGEKILVRQRCAAPIEAGPIYSPHLAAVGISQLVARQYLVHVQDETPRLRRRWRASGRGCFQKGPQRRRDLATCPQHSRRSLNLEPDRGTLQRGHFYELMHRAVRSWRVRPLIPSNPDIFPIAFRQGLGCSDLHDRPQRRLRHERQAVAQTLYPRMLRRWLGHLAKSGGAGMGELLE